MKIFIKKYQSDFYVTLTTVQGRSDFVIITKILQYLTFFLQIGIFRYLADPRLLKHLNTIS